MQLEMTSETRGGVLLLTLQGRIDFSEAEWLARELAQRIADGQRRIVMDFSQVQAVTNHGLRALLRVSRELSNQQGKLALHSLNDSVRQSLDTTGSAMLLRVHASLEDALASIGNTGLLPACPIRR